MVDTRFRPTLKGKIPPQDITMYLDDSSTAFHGFEDLTVVENIDSIANPFSFRIPQKYSDPLKALSAPSLGSVQSLAGGSDGFAVYPGMKVEIYVNDIKVVTGRIDRVEIEISSRAKGMTVSGRSIVADLVDCTVDAPYEYSDISILSLAKKLVSQFDDDIKVLTSVTPTKLIDKIAIKPGETVFEVLNRAAREQGFFWLATRGGNIRLTEGAQNEEGESGLSVSSVIGAAASALGFGSSRFRADSRIEEDVNLKSGRITIDDSQRFSDYTVKGSTRGQDTYPGAVASISEGIAKDMGIDRYRPMTIISEGNIDIIDAQKRAQWEAANRIGRAVQIEIVVQNWLQEDSDKLWGVNQLISIKSPTLGMDGDFLSTSVERIRSNGEGTLSRISLTREDAFIPEPVIPADGAGAESLEAIIAKSQGFSSPL